ncbi:MAG: SIS domain-containing protein [Firmicutes bacterium]|nr:SIS domain-containing protein [Bacillota bacterium]
MIDKYLQEINDVTNKIEFSKVIQAVDILHNAYKLKKIVFSVGNGGSSSTSSHFSADLGKFAVGNKTGFKSIDISGNVSAHTAWTNDNSWDDVWYEMLNPWISEGDILVLFSVNGGSTWSNNLCNAIQLAKERKAITIGFSGNGGGYFEKNCDVSVVVPTPKNKKWITPITESVHVTLHHGICDSLRSLIDNEN